MSDWISVEDRLPDEDTLVVVADLSYCSQQTDMSAAVCWFLHDKFKVYTDGIEASNYDGGAVIELSMNITHWSPLPELPKLLVENCFDQWVKL